VKIWVDADAAPKPIKEVVFRVSRRLRIPVRLVANRFQQTPRFKMILSIQVSAGADVADDYIVDHCEAGDIVITQDIPLADRVIEKGAHVLQPRGGALTAANIKQRLSVRDFMDDLRGTGVQTGGPPPFSTKDRQRFANELDRLVSQLRR
jgi:hypothetical protein